MTIPSRRIIRSSSYARLCEEAASRLSPLSRESEAIVLSAMKGAADDFVRAAARPGLCGVHRMTLTQLAASLATRPMAERALAPLSALATEAAAARVTHALGQKGELRYFAPVTATPGFAGALAATFGDLRLEAIPPAQLAKAGGPGRDLALLLSLYEDELAARSLADLAAVFELATAVAAGGAHRLLGLPLILLDVPLAAGRQRELLQQVAGRSPFVLAAALSGDERTLAVLEQLLGVTAEDLDPPGPARSLDRVRQYLFSPDVPRATGTDSTLDYFSAPGEAMECVEIARRIGKLAADGVPFDRIAVFLRSPERYQALIEEALTRAGIPAYFSRPAARPDPAGRAFLALLACALDGCSASRFAEYLSLGQVPGPGAAPGERDGQPPDDELLASFHPVPPEEDAPAEETPDPATDNSAVIAGTLQTPIAWEKLLVDAAVIGGPERWARRLRGLDEELRLKLAELKSAEEPLRVHLERQLERLANLVAFALPLIDRLASLPPRATWGEWLQRLDDLAHAALRRPESVLSVLAELAPMEHVGPASLHEVQGVLARKLRLLRRPQLQRRYGRVFIGATEEARGRCFEVVFLPGLAEGLFPRRPSEDPLLLDLHRLALPGRLAVQEDRVAGERLRLTAAVASAGTRLVFSYPRVDVAQARPRVPSFYALEILRAALGCLPELHRFEKQAAEAAPSRLDWPAPSTPADAIDDAEFDLASLRRAFSAPPEQALGAGRYLVEVNAHLGRSLRTRWQRWRPAWSGADGLVDPDAATRAALAPHRLSARSYSATALQQFAACPYRFLLYAVHQLREREEAVALEQMDPLTRGALFHAAQRELFTQLVEHELLPLSPVRLEWALALADQVLDRVSAGFEERLAPAIPRVWRNELEDLRTDLRGWVRDVCHAGEPWLPSHFELAFGLETDSSRDPASRAGDVALPSGVRLRGAIDLVEKHPERGVLRVTDHKTGKPPDRPPHFVGGGAYLQPLLYAEAAEALLGMPVEAARLYYCTQRGGYKPLPVNVTGQARQALRVALDAIDAALAEGFLPAAPQPDACATCAYRPVCGPYEAERVRRKRDDERFDPLGNLRNLP